MNLPPISEWNSIFLDTSVIIDNLLDPEKHKNNPLVAERISKTHKLFDFFAETYSPENKRTFYISAITISELLKSAEGDENIRMLIEYFDFADVVFIDFTKEIANDINNNLKFYLPEENINQFLGTLENKLKHQNIFNARGWVTDDLKINASANFISRKLDVILTSDHNTFVPISKKFNLPTLCTTDLPLGLYNEIDYNSPIEIKDSL